MFVTCAIAGTKFRDIEAQVTAARLEKGEPLVLVPEPTNAFDPHAVKVVTPTGIFLGYVPRVWSTQVASAIKQEVELRSVAGATPGSLIIESVNDDLLNREQDFGDSSA